ncbi:unnamed protein product [Phytophthora lilii]|uniref:Unnamed protein product n=1 Tax=Phytophthora lilii TaxID=2077276 RepID=A0A9W6X3S5_9STRA|nr:unnamed protein product [Phytophthora lilii]
MTMSKRALTVFAVAMTGEVAAQLNVTVHLDATYEVDSARGPVCAGVGDLPTGAACPLKGDVAIADCHADLFTFNGTDCVATVDAVCVIDADSKWGCAFAGGDDEMEDLTSTLTILSEQPTEESPWGDLPWRAPPPIDSVIKDQDTEQIERSSELQIM